MLEDTTAKSPNVVNEDFMRSGTHPAHPRNPFGCAADARTPDPMDHGSDVLALRTALVEHGVSVDADAKVGVRTREALIRFQRLGGSKVLTGNSPQLGHAVGNTPYLG